MVELLIAVLILLGIGYGIFAFIRAIYRKIQGALDERSFERSEQERVERERVTTQSSRQRVQRQVDSSERVYLPEDSSERVYLPEDSYDVDRERQAQHLREQQAIEKRQIAEHEAEMARIQREADERLLERELAAQGGGLESDLERRAIYDAQRRKYKLKHNIREFSGFVSGRYTLTPSQCGELWSNRPDSDKCRNVTGVYILHNETQDRYYVGQSVKVFNRLTQHFSGKNGNMDVLMDYLRGDHWNIHIIRLRDTTYDNLDDLERNTIALYDAFESGYNATRGNGNWVATGDLRREVLPNTDQYFAKVAPATQAQRSDARLKMAPAAQAQKPATQVQRPAAEVQRPAAQAQKPAARPVPQRQQQTSPPIDRQRRVRRSTRSTRKTTNAA